MHFKVCRLIWHYYKALLIQSCIIKMLIFWNNIHVTCLCVKYFLCCHITSPGYLAIWQVEYRPLCIPTQCMQNMFLSLFRSASSYQHSWHDQKKCLKTLENELMLKKLQKVKTLLRTCGQLENVYLKITQHHSQSKITSATILKEVAKNSMARMNEYTHVSAQIVYIFHLC